MENKEEVKEVLVQEFKFNLKGTKAMGKKVFIDSWNAQKEAAKDGETGKTRGRLGRFDPEKAWDTMFKKNESKPSKEAAS